MKTVKIFWLLFAALFMSAILPSQAAVPNSTVDVTIDFVASTIDVPDDGYAPYNEFDHFCAISENVVGFDIYEDMNHNDLKNITIEEDTDTVLLKFYYNQNTTGYKADPWYKSDVAVALYGGQVVEGQTTAVDGLNKVNTTYIETWLNNESYDHTSAKLITEVTYDDWDTDWHSPVIWYEPGFTVFGVGEQSVLSVGSSMTVSLKEGKTYASLTSFCMNMYEMEDEFLLEKWYSYHSNLEIGVYIADSGSAKGVDTPFSMVYVMLGLLSVAAIAALVNKRN